MSAKPILLILGAGSNIGAHVANTFRAASYRIALTSRSAKQSNDPDTVHIAADLTDPSSVPGVFEKVKAQLGSFPSVVVYNASSATANEAKNPFSLDLKDFEKDFTVNTTSAFVAAQEAVKGFAQLSENSSRTFIYTGNFLNITTMAPLLTLGVGKTATAHIIESAAQAYKERGWKFYYADERKPDGGAAYRDIDGEAHGKFYLELSKSKEQGPWQQTFVKGQGYTKF